MIAIERTRLLHKFASFRHIAPAWQGHMKLQPLLDMLEHANNKGLCDSSCTEQACSWNQTSHKDVVPKRITDLIVRSKLATGRKTTNQEELRMEMLQEFDSRIESHRNFDQSKFETLIKDIREMNKNSVILKCIHVVMK